MASISTDQNGNRTIQFVGSDRKRRSVRLGKVTKKDAESVCTKLETILACKLSQRPFDAETAAWIGGLDPKLADRIAAVGLIPPREHRVVPTLKGFTDGYISKRHDVKPRTIIVFRQAQRSLLEYFGETRQLPTITPGDMEDWQRWMIGKGLAENTHRKRAAIAKLFFNAAIKHKLVQENPCRGLKCRLIVVEEKQRIISPEDVRQVLGFCHPELRAIVCLARFAALRCPSETIGLRWSDIDWAEERFTVRSPKTEGHGKSYRSVPLVPEVREALTVLWEALPENADELVFPRFAARNGVGAAFCGSMWRKPSIVLASTCLPNRGTICGQVA
jgi:site-specific recombinase XerC